MPSLSEFNEIRTAFKGLTLVADSLQRVVRGERMSTGNRKGAGRMEKALKTRMVFAGHPYTREPTSCVLGEKRIPRETAAVASLRRFVHDIAADWKAAEDIPETAALLVSELATNALTHGSSDAPATSTITSPSPANAPP